MSEMVERVAMAMAKAADATFYKTDRDGMYAVCEDRTIAIEEMARAAIEAMSEPTEEMLKAFYGDVPVEKWLGNDWRDMIEAALQ